MTAAAPPDGPAGYIPALHYRRLTPLYDPVLRWLFREEALKRRLVSLADLRAGQRVLDLGCGTGTLTILLKRTQPGARVIGLDGDPEVLRIARRKAVRAGLEIRWDEGLAEAMPYPSAFCDTVVSSLMLHHLTPETRAQALAEVARVLRPGGRFVAADFGPPRSGLARALAKVSEILEETADGVTGRLPGMFAAAGLADAVEEAGGLLTPMGTVVFFRARKPGP